MKAILTELVLNTVAVPIVGAPDMVVTADDVPDETDVPVEFVAVTVNVYTVLDVNPDTIIGEDEPVPVKPPGLLVTV
jgi:ABC-type amino acid transport system permease subunit